MSGRGVSDASQSSIAVGRHHRRVRRPQRRGLRGHGPLVLLGTGAAILTCVAGFALGSFVLGGFASAPPQSAAYGIPNAPPGVSFVQAIALFVNSTTTPATGACTASNVGNSTSPTALTNGAATAICLSHSATGYTAGDTIYTLEVQWNSTSANATVFKVQVAIDVTPTANDISATCYLKTSATITTSEQAVFSVDLIQQGDTSVTQFAVLVTEL